MAKQHQWALLQEIYDFCQDHAFNFEITYQECEDTFSLAIEGLGMSEEFGEEYYVKRNGSIEIMVEYFREWRKSRGRTV